MNAVTQFVINGLSHFNNVTPVNMEAIDYFFHELLELAKAGDATAIAYMEALDADDDASVMELRALAAQVA